MAKENFEDKVWGSLGLKDLGEEFTNYSKQNSSAQETYNTGSWCVTQSSNCESKGSHCESQGSHCQTRQSHCENRHE